MTPNTQRAFFYALALLGALNAAGVFSALYVIGKILINVGEIKSQVATMWQIHIFEHLQFKHGGPMLERGVAPEVIQAVKEAGFTTGAPPKTG